MAALALAGVNAARTQRTLQHSELPTDAVLALAARGQLTAMTQLVTATRRTWWPAALLTRRGRRLLLASLLPCLLTAAAERRGPRWTALRVLDDLAYGAGVWTGCLIHHTAAPLLPQLTHRRERPDEPRRPAMAPPQ